MRIKVIKMGREGRQLALYPEKGLERVQRYDPFTPTAKRGIGKKEGASPNPWSERKVTSQPMPFIPLFL